RLARHGATEHSGNCRSPRNLCRFSENKTAAGTCDVARSARRRLGAWLVQPPALREGGQTMVDRDPSTCDRVCREISNYLEGDVVASVRASMDDHFLACAHCRSVLEGTRNVIRLYSAERRIDVPTGFGKRLEKRLARNARTLRPTWSSWSAWLIPVA